MASTNLDAVENAKAPPRKSEQDNILYSSNDPCQIQEWYPTLKKFTFKTEVIPLTPQQASALKNASQHFKMHKQYIKYAKTQKSGTEELELNFDITTLIHSMKTHENDPNNIYEYGERFHWKKAKIDQKDLDSLTELATNIDTIITDMNCKDNGIFVRLSTRSPKDSALESVAMFKLLKQELMKQKDEKKEIDNMDIIHSFYRSAINALCVYNGTEGVELFCRSYRTFVDINMAMLQQDEENLKLYVIVREWNHNIDTLWEFRMFLRNKIPTAITQYHKNIYLNEMSSNKELIKDNIVEKYNTQIKQLLDEKLCNFTMDFAVIVKNDCKDNNECIIDKIIVIEINHEPPIAGTGLFEWENKKDRDILDNGPLEIRVDDKPYTGKLETILPDSTIIFVKAFNGESIQIEKEQKEQEHVKQVKKNNIDHKQNKSCHIL